MTQQFTIIIGALFLLLTSCQNERINPENNAALGPNQLIGKWSQDASPHGNLLLKREYVFNKEGAFEILEKIVNSSGDLQGFRQKATGTYELKDSKLKFTYEQYYNADLSTDFYAYDDLADLTPSDPVKDFTITFSVSFVNKENRLTLTSHCEPHKVCLGNLTKE